jgi:hypothetical protein
VNNFISEGFHGFDDSEIYHHVIYENGTWITNWIIVIIAGCFVVVLPLRVFDLCMPRAEYPRHDYTEKKMLLMSDYDRLNPVTRDTAIMEFNEYIDNLDRTNRLPHGAREIHRHVTMVIENENRKMKSLSSMHSYMMSTLKKSQDLRKVPLAKNRTMLSSQLELRRNCGGSGVEFL